MSRRHQSISFGFAHRAHIARRKPWVPGGQRGRSFPDQEHHAPQGAAGCGEIQTVRQARARDHRIGQVGPAGSRDESAPARRHVGGTRGEHAQGQNRSRDQESGGRRGGKLRGNSLRGLWTGRHRRHRRGVDRQPQPHRGRGARRLHQIRRSSCRDRRGLLHVRPRGLDRVRSQGGRRGCHAGGGDRGGRRRRGVQRERTRNLHDAGFVARGCQGTRRQVRRSNQEDPR